MIRKKLKEIKIKENIMNEKKIEESLPIKQEIKEPIKIDFFKDKTKEKINRFKKITGFQIVIILIGWLLILPFTIFSIIPSIIYIISSLFLILFNNFKRKGEIEEIKTESVDNRFHFKFLVGSHIVLFVHRENNSSYIIGYKQIHSLTECVRLNHKEIAYKIDTTKPTLIWGNIRLYLIDCEASQQISLNPNEKVIGINTIYDYCYKESLYKMTKSVHKGSMQNLSLLIGFVMGFGIIGLILMCLINFGVI